MQQNNLPHNFYIPVMGTGFTIDSPLFVAKYGISSVISLVDDLLLEQMRKYWSEKFAEPYQPITANQEDARAKRITAYLNLLDKLVQRQIAEVKASAFEPNSEITKYFEMLPNGHKLKLIYEQMLKEENVTKKIELQEQLRQAVTAGSIDVNIMTKLDRENYAYGEKLPYEFCDAAAALRGYAQSNLCSTIELSAGFNPNLYGYLTKFADFYPDKNSVIKKKICLKVSDYRSAAIQGKYLAKRGIWVSEYRIESPINCGGHAFINDGQLMGPILAEFKQRKNELLQTLRVFYNSALANIKKFCTEVVGQQNIRITAQGGVGTNSEHEFLLRYYEIDAAGWGSPFLLVPEATNVDETTLNKLVNAKDGDVFLSDSSPLGVPFWNLKNSSSEEARDTRIKHNNPGSVCVKGHIKLNQELTKKPVCQASREYQALKLKALAQSDLAPEMMARLKEEVLAKSCICHDLGGGVLIRREIDPQATPAICSGPNIINFKKIVTLKEMIGHIYGRCSILTDHSRPHMFIKELQLQVSYLLNETKNASVGLPTRSQQKIIEVKNNLNIGIEYYRGLAKELLKGQREKFLQSLEDICCQINNICLGEIPGEKST